MKKLTIFTMLIIASSVVSFGQVLKKSINANLVEKQLIQKPEMGNPVNFPVKKIFYPAVKAAGDTFRVEGTVFPEAGWTLEYAGTVYWTQAAANGPSVTGSNAAKFNSYTAAAGTVQSIVSPQFAPTTADKRLSFDVAHAPYTGLAEDDSLIVYTSTDGTTFTVLAGFNGNGGVGVGIQTAAATGSPFTPTAAQWTTKSIALPVGTVKYKISARSDYGNNIWLDNVIIYSELSNDLMVSMLQFPSGVLNIGTVTLKAVVKNNGSAAQTAGKVVTFKQGATVLGTATTTLALNSGDADTVLYDWNATAIGVYSLSAEISADDNNSNNIKNATVYIDNENYMYESFEDITALPPADWTVVSDWDLGTNPTYALDSVQYAYCPSGASNAYLVTPRLNITSGDYIAFHAFTSATASNPSLTLKYSTDKVNWTDLGSAITLTGSYTRYHFPLTISGQYYFAFVCDNASSTSARMDLVICPPKFVADNDVAVTAINLTTLMASGSQTPIATVKNNGLLTQTFDVTLTISGGYSNTQTVTALAGGMEQQVTFNAWNAVNGNYSAVVTANLTGDAFPSDNTIAKDVIVQPLKKVYGYVLFTDNTAIVNGPAYFYLQEPGSIVSLADQSAEVPVFNGSWANGKWYACTNPDAAPGDLVTFDTTSGARTVIGNTGYEITGMSFDKSTNTMYAIASTETDVQLLTVDLTTGAATPVGSSNATTFTLLTFACNSTGTLYSIGTDKNLYTIDKSTGAYTLVGPTGVGEVAYAQDMEFDHDNGDNLYWCLSNNTVGELYHVNTTTGAAAFIGQLESNAEIAGFAIPFMSSSSSGYKVTGVFKYNNTANTPLANVTVNLMNGASQVATTTTNGTGNYMFDNVTNGTYNISATSTGLWSGVTATDALKIKRHLAGLEFLTEPVRLTAADANNSMSISATDALKIQRRLAGLESTFTRGDWVFEKPSTGGTEVVVNNTDATQDFYGLCTGDVNGSNIPAAFLRRSTVELNNSQTLNVNAGSQFEIPVSINENMSVGAIQLSLEFNNELVDIIDVRMNASNEDLVYNISGNKVSIIWSGLNSINTNNGSTVIVLVAKAKTQQGRISMSFADYCEVADEFGNTVACTFNCPSVEISRTLGITGSNLNSEINLYPNPAKQNITIAGTEAGSKIEIISSLGSIVKEINATAKSQIIDVSAINEGVYFIHITNGNSRIIKKISVIK